MVATTRTHDGGWLSRALLYPRNIGFHAVHHLHPVVSMDCLPVLHAWYCENEPGYQPANHPQERVSNSSSASAID
jgi:fatty acid desaturase